MSVIYDLIIVEIFKKYNKYETTDVVNTIYRILVVEMSTRYFTVKNVHNN
jgi:hypothetical protein